MKALLIFLLCSIPATAVLAYLDRDDRRGGDLPEEGPPADAPVLLDGTDLADPYGQSPFSGALRRLDGFELRVVEEGYFKLYLRIERLGRHGGQPRLEEVRAAVFDPPKGGKPNLRLTLRAPFAGGDPREMLHARPDAPRVVTLDGGVEAFDALGRPLAEVERLSIDANAKTLAADVPIVLRLPERAAEVRAAGLDADLRLRKARLKGPVVASVGMGTGTITLRAKGGATVEEEGEEIRVAFDGDAEIEDALGRATCQRIDAAFSRAEGKAVFLRATLSGGVRLDLAPGAGRGIETIEMPSLTIEGEERISCEGPLRAAWRGSFSAGTKGTKGVFLPLGERTARIDATAASFRLGRAEDGRLVLREARFAGFAAADADGGGSLAGRSIACDLEAGALVIEGAVDARTPEGSLVADRLRIESPGKGAYDLRVEGEKRIVYRAGGRLGPLGDGGAGELRLTAAGALAVLVRGDAVSFRCEEEVVATTDGGARLRCDLLAVALEKGTLVSFAATGGVEALGPSRGARIEGRSLAHEAGATTVEGDPASIATKDGRSVRAPTIVYRDDRAFLASGGVEVEAPLEGGGIWRLACKEVRGALAADGAPASIEASGSVHAVGPQGEEADGDVLAYDGGKGIAKLLGSPARVRRGEEIVLVAPKGLSLRIEEGRIAEGSSLGPSTIDYRPSAPEGEAPKGFHRWIAELKGPARFEADRVVVPLGAKLKGLDGDREALVAEANRVEILLDTSAKAVTVREMAGSKGVRVESRGKDPAVVTADRLSYVAGTREVRVAGNAQVAAQGWPREVRFREVLFALTKDGIDLRRASGIEVR